MRTQPILSSGCFLTPSTEALGPGSDSGRSLFCGLQAPQHLGRGHLGRGCGTALQATPEAFLSLSGPLRSLLTSLGLTISCPSAAQSIQPSHWGEFPYSPSGGALHPAQGSSAHRAAGLWEPQARRPPAGRQHGRGLPDRVAPPCGKSTNTVYRALCPTHIEIM